MARLRKYSTALETARTRLRGLKSINPAPSYGSGLTIHDYESKISSVEKKLAEYDQTRAALDKMLFQLEKEESELSDLNARCLAGIGAQYGRDSSEYEMAGGTRTRERKRPIRRAGHGSSSRKS